MNEAPSAPALAHKQIGKLVAGRRYFHTCTLGVIDAQAQELAAAAANISGVKPDVDFNVVRIDESGGGIALLHYPEFFTEACPQLLTSWKVELNERRSTVRSYQDSFNRPILHRKELLLSETDSRKAVFERLTAELEAQGFFCDPVRIGFKLQWEKLLAERGFRIVGHQLTPIGNEEGDASETDDGSRPIQVARHLTALSRQNLSAPVQILRRFGFFDNSRSLFDYGCGKGDDVSALCADGIPAAGWDPHYAAKAPIAAADIVNLGFVINVIEDPVERRDALQRAFSLAKELLVVSTMIATDNPGKVTHYGDGVLTSRFTFQKYYTQAEFRAYLSTTLGEEPISVAPGIFFVFKDKYAEQRFQSNRYRSCIRVRPLIPLERPAPVLRPPSVRELRQPRAPKVKEPIPDKYEIHRALLDPLWQLCLDLGREPDATEVQGVQALEDAFGSLKKALRVTLSRNDQAQLERAHSQRADDLKVFLAAQLFQKRKPYKQLEARLQRDVRAFFGDYGSAQEHAKHLLHQVAQPELLDEACRIASEQGLGFLQPSHSLQLHSSLVSRLPAALRVYVGCAGMLYGDVSESDLVKLHIRSGKVSFMKFDDFVGVPIPRMTERMKVNLRTLDSQFFAYGNAYPPPPLYLKSRYINEEFPHYAEQVLFDESLEALGISDFSSFGPPIEHFQEALRRARWAIKDFKLVRLQNAANLDDPCGRYLTYRQLIECGETQIVTKIANLPKHPDSYTALLELARNILDPVIEYFGRIELTYGFCSQQLGKHIRRRVAPELDQHAAHEVKRTGVPVCTRSGAAADFLVRDEDMRGVAQWIIGNLPFDRLYYYGHDRPVHVSYGPERKREAIEMVLTDTGRLIPRPFGRSK